MPITTTFKVEGLTQLGERMRNLNNKVATRSAVRAVAAGAKLVKAAARTNILSSPAVQTRSLLDAVITKKLSKSQTNLTAEYIVTVRRKRGRRKTKTKQAEAPYARFVEFGTVNMPAEPFLQPALARNVRPAIEAMKNRLEEEIVKGGA